MATVRAYERVSVLTEESGSLDRQRAEIERWADYARPGVPVEHYRDEGISGAKAARLRERQRLLSDLQRGDVLAAAKVDRLARNTRDLLDIITRAQGIGADVVFVEQNISTEGAYGKFMIVMLAALAELERDVTGERINAARKTFLAQGRHGMGRLPFGWHAVKDDNKGWLVARPILTEGWCDRCETVHHAEGKRLRKAIRNILNGATFASQWRELGVADTAFSWLVRNPRLYGMPPEEGAIYDPDSALITKAEWLQLQNRLAKPRAWQKQDTLAGAFRCYHCQRRLYHDSRNDKYRCEPRPPKHPGRPTILRETANQFLTEVFHEWYGQFPAYRLVTQDDAERAERLAGIEIDLKQAGIGITAPGADITAISTRITELHAEREAVENEPAAETRLEPTGRTWSEEWNAVSSDDQRVRLTQLMNFHVVIYPHSGRNAPEATRTANGALHTRRGRFEIVELQA